MEPSDRSETGTRAAPVVGVQLDDPATGTTEPAVQSGLDTRKGAFAGGLWNAASAVLPMGATLVLSVVVSRELGPAVLGQQSLVAYVNSLMVSVLIFSFTSASVQMLAATNAGDDRDRLAWLSRWSFAAHLTGGLVSALLLVSIGFARSDYQALWFLAAATAMVDSIGWAHASRDIARHGWGPTASRRLVAQAVSPALAIAAVYAGLGIEGVFTAQLVVAVVLLLVLRRVDRRTQTPSVAGTDRPAWAPVLRLWSMFSLSVLITQIVERRLELVFLDWFHSPETVAMFSVAFNVVGIPTMVSAALIGASMPAIAARHARDPGSVTAALSRAARVVVAVNLVLTAGTIAIGPRLVTTAYGEDFAEAGTLVRLLGLTLLILPLGHLYSALWTGTGHLRPVLIAGGAGAVVDITLAWTLVPPFAASGAVVASLGAAAVSAGLIAVHTHRRGIRLEISPGRLAVTTAIALAAGGAAHGTLLLVGGLAGVVLAVVAFGLVLAVTVRFLGLVGREDTAWLAGTLPGPVGRVFAGLSPRPARTAPTRAGGRHRGSPGGPSDG